MNRLRLNVIAGDPNARYQARQMTHYVAISEQGLLIQGPAEQVIPWLVEHGYHPPFTLTAVFPDQR